MTPGRLIVGRNLNLIFLNQVSMTYIPTSMPIQVNAHMSLIPFTMTEVQKQLKSISTALRRGLGRRCGLVVGISLQVQIQALL